MSLTFQLEHGVVWTATTRLEAWEGYQSRMGRYGAIDRDAPSDGTVRVMLGGSALEPLPPDDGYLALVARVLADEAEVSASVKTGLLAAYPRLCDEMRAALPEAETEAMPDVSDINDFKGLIGLHTLHIHGLEADGFPYTGYEFGCNWEDEHGLGILMHGSRLVEIGHADTAFTEWMAKRDAKHHGWAVTGPNQR